MKSNYKGRKRYQQVPEESHRINRNIRVPEVRLISETGEQIGVVQTKDALERAENIGLDLVEVAAKAKPPVCKIMDYGKMKYREQKKAHEAKKNSSESSIKELRIRYTTDKGDFDTKIDKAKDFLAKGHKVKFTMLFRGREMAFIDLGIEKFKVVAESLEEVAEVDSQSPKPGRQIFVTFKPIRN